MRDYLSADERCRALAEYLTEHGSTVRETAKHFGISKSTVHKDLRERLKSIDRPLYEAASDILEKNKSERHIRGGIATKIKYDRLREERHI
ncbi:MAG: sporulation transcriptional regulator SpoIIID [Clostridia bacterium]|nr:sporulation transcriptional regulator SpoIIID [Clostridia bacterium]